MNITNEIRNESGGRGDGSVVGFYFCNAKTGSYVIGVVQMILSSFGIWVLFWKVLSTIQTSYGHGNTAMALLVLGILIIFLEIQFVAGAILIGAVQQKMAEKIRIWQVIQWAYVTCGTFLLVLLVAAGNVIEVLQTVAALCITIVSIWIVNLHQKELKLVDLKDQNSCV